MRPAVEVRALEDAEALGTIERALHGKLRAHRLSDGFIERNCEDVLQQARAEYEDAVARGSEIDNPGGWIVSTAYRRAIDELRRELREVDEAELPATAGAVEGGDLFSPTEEEAIDNVSADQLRETIAKLSAQQRQALGLYYFEEHTTREAAALLGCGETTFRRHLRSALRVLRQRFGVVPEPGSELAIEVGLVAWASLAGARVVPGRGFLDQLVAAADTMRDAAGTFLERGRDIATRLLASGGGESIGAAASSPLGRASGVCAGALAACVLTGVIGSGVGGVDLVGGAASHPAHSQAPRPHRPAPPAPKLATPTRPAPATKAPTKNTSSPQHASSSSKEERARRATQAATSQFGVESSAPESSYSPPPEPTETASSASSTSSSSPTQVANDQFGP
jgi:RNA polymerase sigma-70 factor (ECF subfamily)